MPEIDAKLKAGQLDEAVELYGTVMELTYFRNIRISIYFYIFLELQNMKVMT